MKNLVLTDDPSGRLDKESLKNAHKNAKECLEELAALVASTPENERKTIIISDKERPC